MARVFEAKPAVLEQVPLLIGLEGPPGGGKTFSALRLAKGMQRVRSGPIVVIDTERGRAAKYAKEFEFLHVAFDPPFKPTDFLQAIRDQLKLNPAAIIVDSLSDEHEGEGGVIDWHDQEVERFRGNEHAAWGKPKADRKRLIGGMLQITVPLILTFRAREKTVQQRNERGKNEVVNIGFQPIAPPEIVHALDLVCLLPNRANGVPQWKSDKSGESFMTKLPNYLAPFIRDGVALNEDMGEAFAKWAAGDGAPPPARKAPEQPRPAPSEPEEAHTQPETPKPAQRPAMEPRERVSNACLAMAKIHDAAALTKLWESMQMADLRQTVFAEPDLVEILEDAYRGRLQSISEPQY